ncbi:peptidylprolyl isomerase [bacterium]|nr:peptidylprolyl isomerase [candidate division CSSED10-310 bacterium]
MKDGVGFIVGSFCMVSWMIVCSGCSDPGAVELGLEGSRRMVVTVDGVNLTQDQMHRELVNLLTTMGAGLTPDALVERRAEFEMQALQNLINTELLVREAERRGLAVSEEAIGDQIAMTQHGYETGQQFRDELELRRLSPEELREEARRALMLEALMESVFQGIPKPEEEEIARFYSENREAFFAPDRIRASHILIRVYPDDTESVQDAKYAEMERIRHAIETGASFESIAESFSECPSSKQGGDLGWFTREQMTPAFATVAFSTPAGTISDIVRTEFGYHLIKVNEVSPAHQATLEEVRGDLGEYILEQRKKNAVQALIESVRASASIVIQPVEG